MDPTTNGQNHGPTSNSALFLLILAVLTVFAVAFISFFTVIFSIMFIVDGKFGDGSRPGKRTEEETRSLGKVLLPISWSLFPVAAAIFVMLVQGPSRGQGYSSFLQCFIDILKGWTLLTLDASFAVAIGFSINKAAPSIRNLIEKELDNDQDSSDAGRSKDRTRWLYRQSLSTLPIGFAVSAWTALMWTTLNIPYYAATFGFFAGRGGFREFFGCYPYTLFTFIELLVLPTLTLLALAGFAAAVYFTVWLLDAVIAILTRFNRKSEKEMADRCNEIPWKIVQALLSWCVALGIVFMWISWSNCQDSRRTLREAIKSLNGPGAENQTLTWTIISNITGTYNVTQAPYRLPLPSEDSLEPLSIKFQCLIAGSGRLLEFLAIAICGVLIVGTVQVLWSLIYWDKMKAFAQGKAYEMVSQE